jgi:hypothetical protein
MVFIETRHQEQLLINIQTVIIANTKAGPHI